MSRLLAGDAGEVLAADLDATRRGLVEPGQDAQRRGLAAARRAEQGDELARREVEGEAVERLDGAVDAGEVGQLDGEPGLGLGSRGGGRHAFCPPASGAWLRLKNESPSSSSEMRTIEAKAPAMAVEVSDL